MGHVGLAQQHLASGIGLPGQRQFVGGVGAFQCHAQQAFPIGLFERSGDPHKVFPFLGEDGAQVACVGGKGVDLGKVVVDLGAVASDLAGGLVL